MIQDNRAFYRELDELILGLVKSGQAELARGLQDAKMISTVPGEILGATYAELEKINLTTVHDETLIAQIENLLAYLQRIV